MDVINILQTMLSLYLFDGDTSKLANASNGVATVTLPATLGKRWSIGLVTVGYNAAPTGGLLTVLEGANPIFVAPITNSNATPVGVYRRGNRGNPMTITLSAGGSNVVGYVNVEAVLGN